jgi:peptide/nickel transport system ATP-binding protein
VSPDVIRFEDVRKTFSARGRSIAAVAGVSFGVAAGRVFGIVGESGSGKSTVANLLARLDQPSGGRILWNGRDTAALAGGELTAFRRAVQMVFQDPFGSLDPRFTVGRTVAEPLVIHGIGDRASRRERVVAALEAAELRPGAALLDRLPHELSGGQRQRVAIARALVLDPEVLVADEPVSMLDVSARAGILDLLRHLVAERGLTLVFITHDLSLIGSICSEVAVMYRGRFVETASPEALLETPLHPYTRALIAAIPVPDPTARRAPGLRGEGRDFGEAGCAYAPRCAETGNECATAPRLVAAAPGRSVACVRRTATEEAR